jgi:ketosteroid isomerase-like protein
MTDKDRDAQAALDVGERLFTIAEHGDLQELREVFAEGAVCWHNDDERLTDVETTIRNLHAIRKVASEFRYTDIRRQPTPTGFVQQHTLIIRTPDRDIRDLCCCVCLVANGRVTRMDAYHDSAATNAMPHKSKLQVA